MRKKVIKTFDNIPLLYEYEVYENGDIVKLSTKNSMIRPTKDPRRPNEPPIVYLKKEDGKRIFCYYDDFMAKLFLDYDGSRKIHHKDGDMQNCSLSNLSIDNPIDILTNYYNETKRWCKVTIPNVKLYYDYYVCEDGRLYNATTDAFVKPFKDTRKYEKDYLRYNLYKSKSVNDVIQYSVGRLVAEHFIPIEFESYIVRYIDGDSSNCDVSNLMVVDAFSELSEHAVLDEDSSQGMSVLNFPAIGKEKWKQLEVSDVKFSHNYYVSSYGRVYDKTLEKFVHQSILKRSKINGRYRYMVTLHTITDSGDTRKNIYTVHRLVALMFCKNDDPENKTEVNHINGIPSCNLAINLEWISSRENMIHAVETNLIHSSRYNSQNNSPTWNSLSLISWAMVVTNGNLKESFKMYTKFIKTYTHLKLKFDESITDEQSFNDFYDSIKNTDDFMTISNKFKSYSDMYADLN